MGYGNYSAQAHVALTKARKGKSADQVFTSTTCPPELDPLGVVARESRDSTAHPESVAVVFALDVSGSMGTIPHGLATRTLPTFMGEVRRFLPDVQLCFMAVGNAWADSSPLQVGQFESEAGAMDRWLSMLHMEGGGGGLGESYDLAMYFLVHHTRVDCLERRKKKGYVFFTGDEPPFVHVDPGLVKKVIGDQMEGTMDLYQVTEALLAGWNVFFLIPNQASATQYSTGDIWANLFHEAAVVLDNPDDTAVVSALLVGLTEGAIKGADGVGPWIDANLDLPAAHRDRLVRTVTPYAAAIAQGPLAPPTRMGEKEPDSSIQG